MKTFEYDLTGFAEPADEDVVARRVFATLDGSAQPPADVPLDQDTYTLKGVQVGQTVEITYRFVDDAGNESEPSPPVTFTSVDDVAPAPPAAGQFGVVDHRQVFTADAATGTGETGTVAPPTPPPDVTPSP